MVNPQVDPNSAPMWVHFGRRLPESNRIAAGLVKENLAFLGQPEISAGEVIAHEAAAAKAAV